MPVVPLIFTPKALVSEAFVLSHRPVHFTVSTGAVQLYWIEAIAISSQRGAITGYPRALVLKELVGFGGNGFEAGKPAVEGTRANQPFVEIAN